MRTKYSRTWKSIEESCKERCWDVETIYKRAELILRSYREVCWKTRARARDVTCELSSLCSSKLEGALIYLESFAPEKEKDCFQSKVESLFETKALVKMVEKAAEAVKKYPRGGGELYEILFLRYLSEYSHCGKDVWEILNMERSVYYDKQKDAILVFAFQFWAIALPKFKEAFLIGTFDEDEYFDDGDAWE